MSERSLNLNSRVWRRLSGLYMEHAGFIQILLLFVSFRVMAIFFLLPGGFIDRNGGSDLWLYEGIGTFAASGFYPFIDYWLEYPPIVPGLMIAAYKLSLGLAPWIHRRLWFNTFFRLALLPFDVGNIILIYLIVSHLVDRRAGQQSAAAYGLLFGPLFVFLGWFDNAELFFILLGLYGLIRRRPVLAAFGIGVGFSVKLFSFTLIPAALHVFRSRRDLVILVAGILFCVAVIFVPLFIAGPTYTLAFFQNLGARGSWTSSWAILEGNYAHGVVAPLGVRNDPATALWVPPTVASDLPWLWVSLAFAALGLFLWTRPIDWAEPRRVAAFGGLTFVLLMLYARTFSPQWGMYMATLALVLLPGLRGILYSIAFSLFVPADWPVLVWLLPALSGAAEAVVLLRTALMVALSLDLAALFMRFGDTTRRIQTAALPAVLVLTSLAAVGFAYPAYRSYNALRLEREPIASVLERLPTESLAPVITVQSHVFERVQPFAQRGQVLLLPNATGYDNEPLAWVRIPTWLEESLEGRDRAWLVFDNSEELRRELYSEVRAWFDDNACTIQQTWYETTWVGEYALARAGGEQAADILFGNNIRLDSYSTPVDALAPGEAFCIILEWSAVAPPPADFTIFVHLFGLDGQLVAQSDLWPNLPTTGWQVGALVETRHGLLFPTSLPPGEYLLRAGWYSPGDGSRVLLDDGSDAANLGTIVVRQ